MPHFNPVPVSNKKFVFDDFILNMDGSLLRAEKKVNIPPKEYAVLVILLEAAGEIVSKNTLLDQVWGDAEVNEESLTRCIYALRRILSEDKEHRYIETLYGQGYRFNRPVVVVSPPAPQPTTHTLAILPFQMQDQIQSENLHYSIVKGLSQYAPFGLSVLPVTITKNCRSVKDILELMDQLRPDYYISGQMIPDGNDNVVQIEIVRVKGYNLLHQESIKLIENQPASLLQNKIANLLLRCIPGLRWDTKQVSELNSIDSTMVYLRGKHELNQYTPYSLQQALKLLTQCVNMSPNSIAPYCALAECYLSMAQMGIFDKQNAMIKAKEHAIKATELDHNNPQALGLLGLINTIHSEYIVGSLLFKQANLLSPISADIKYYYGWNLFMAGQLEEALQTINECLKLDPTRAAAGITKLWITYYHTGIDDAIRLGDELRSQHLQDNPILLSMQVMFLSLKGKYELARKLTKEISTHEITGLIAVNLLYAEYCQNSERALPAIREFLESEQRIDNNPGLLPLVLVAHGEVIAENMWNKFKNEDNIWFKRWKQDPRLVKLR